MFIKWGHKRKCLDPMENSTSVADWRIWIPWIGYYCHRKTLENHMCYILCMYLNGSITYTTIWGHIDYIGFRLVWLFFLLNLQKFKLNKEMNGAFQGAHVGLKKEHDFGCASKTIKWDLNLLKWDRWKQQSHIVWSDMSSSHFNWNY